MVIQMNDSMMINTISEKSINVLVIQVSKWVGNLIDFVKRMPIAKVGEQVNNLDGILIVKQQEFLIIQLVGCSDKLFDRKLDGTMDENSDRDH